MPDKRRKVRKRSPREPRTWAFYAAIGSVAFALSCWVVGFTLQETLGKWPPAPGIAFMVGLVGAAFFLKTDQVLRGRIGLLRRTDAPRRFRVHAIYNYAMLLLAFITIPLALLFAPRCSRPEPPAAPPTSMPVERD
jgi:hypothetical protein